MAEYIVNYVFDADVYVTVNADNEREAKEEADRKILHWKKDNPATPNMGGIRIDGDMVWTSTERQRV